MRITMHHQYIRQKKFFLSVLILTVQAIQIADWERTKADLLYHKGDIMTLWIYLSERFSRYDNILNAPLPKSTPPLHHLLLRYVEVSFLIRKMTSPVVKSGMHIDALLKTLDRIIDTPQLHPEHKSRAIILRVAEQALWYADRVEDVHGDPASEALKQTSIRLIKEAYSIHENFATQNGAAVNFVYATVRRSLGYSQEDSWNKVCAALPSLDRDDLYFSMKGITQKLARAINARDVPALRACLPALNETLSLGEWGKMFYDKWWRQEEQRLRNTDLWKQANAEISTPSHSQSNMAKVDRSTPMPTTPSGSQGRRIPGFGGVVARQFSQAVVNTVVRDANQAITNSV